MIILEPVRIAELLAPLATLIVGTAQCWLIGMGLRRMDRAAVERDRRMDQQDREADRRHQETMAQLNRVHEERMAQSNRAHQENMAQWNRAHEENMTALHTLIRRTAPPGAESRGHDV